MKRSIQIGNRMVGEGNPTYVIADPAANHEGRYETMEKLLIAAARAGADAFKTQTYRPEDLTIDCKESPFMLKGTLWDGQSLWDLYKQAAIPWEWNEKLMRTARDLNIDLFSTAYSLEALKYLVSIGVPAIKIASFEMNNDAFLVAAAMTPVPLIVSTGMSSMEEIRHAKIILEGKRVDFALLHCVSAYPANTKDLHLKRVRKMMGEFSCPIGFSDHSLDASAPSVAVALGATIIEKHIRLTGQMDSLDAGFSLREEEFAECVTMIRGTERALGNLTDEQLEDHLPVPSELTQLRRSLFVVKDVKFGDRATSLNIAAIRPGSGLSPKYFSKLLGRRFMKDVKRGTPLEASHLEWSDSEL